MENSKVEYSTRATKVKEARVDGKQGCYIVEPPDSFLRTVVPHRGITWYFLENICATSWNHLILSWEQSCHIVELPDTFLEIVVPHRGTPDTFFKTVVPHRGTTLYFLQNSRATSWNYLILSWKPWNTLKQLFIQTSGSCW